MAFRLKLTETMEDGIRRVGLEQIDRALVHCGDAAPMGDSETPPAKAPPTDEVRAVHETRKCLKRFRALLRFGRPLLAKAQFRELDHAARAIGRKLSETRDLDVLDHTVARLQTAGALKPATLERLHRMLDAARRQAVPDGATADAANPLKTIVKTDLEALRGAWNAVPIEQAGHELIGDGLGASFAHCRARFERAFETEDDEHLHDWRKSVQLHWRHMQLVQRAWPEYCRARLTEAKAISALIGDDRDLAMLQVFATEQKLPQVALRDLDRAVLRLGQGYRQEARARGQRLLAEGPRGLTRRLSCFWSEARRLRKHTASDAPAVNPTA